MHKNLACNKKYPLWVNTMLDRYSDIDRSFYTKYVIGIVTILAASKNLDVADGMKFRSLS